MHKTKLVTRFLYLFCLSASLFLSGCTDKEAEVKQVDYCLNHYRAKSYKVALKECQIAAEQGSSQALWLMANFYRFDLLDEGVDLTEAFNWYLKAAKKGHTPAMREVGIALLYANGVSEDLDSAYTWLMKAAKQQDARAEFSVGIIFFEGKGRTKDLGSAVNWFKRAATQKHTMSINNLAWVFATSTNKAFNSPKKAKFWIEKMEKQFFEVPMFLDTKAAVMAAQKNFKEAIKLQNSAIAKLSQETPENELLEYQKHLESYLKEEAWNE